MLWTHLLEVCKFVDHNEKYTFEAENNNVENDFNVSRHGASYPFDYGEKNLHCMLLHIINRFTVIDDKKHLTAKIIHIKKSWEKWGLKVFCFRNKNRFWGQLTSILYLM